MKRLCFLLTLVSILIRAQNEMNVKGQRVKYLIDNMIDDVNPQVRKKRRNCRSASKLLKFYASKKVPSIM